MDRLIRLNVQALMWGFIVVGALFFLVPDGVANFTNSLGRSLGDFTDAPLTGFRLWLSLGTAYMALVSILAWLIQRDPHGNRKLLLVLAAGKFTSSITCLYFYFFTVDAFGYLLNFLLDGSITLNCLLLYVLLDPARRERAGEDALAEGTEPRAILKDVLRVIVPEDEQTMDARLTDYLAALDARAPAALIPALYIIQYGPYLWGPRRVRFSALTAAEQDAYIAAYQKSRFYPRYLVLFPIRFLATAIFYDDEHAATKIGYRFPDLPVRS